VLEKLHALIHFFFGGHQYFNTRFHDPAPSVKLANRQS
jgi:hypothetical protein